MAIPLPSSRLDQFTTFGDLLRFLRRRMGMTQLDLALEVGYSDTHISRLERNERLPDILTIEARFLSALGLEDEPEAVARLLDLAANVRREDAPALGLCPYKGLNCFEESDADLFVGREVLTAKLAERVLALISRGPPDQKRFLAVVGASGSGKSSLVRAGLVPALRWNKKSADLQIHLLTPTARPLESLATSLTLEIPSVTTTAHLIDDLAGDTRSLHLFAKRALGWENNPHLLLVVDQFEELFALCRSEEERTSFIDNLLAAASEADGPVIVVIALRADFYARCAQYRQLRAALAENQEFIGAMSNEELRAAIEEPARRGQWEFEPGLVDLLLRDAGDEPGALPLLSHTLLETWQRRRGRTMTLGGYASSGGVHGAIAATAEAVFADRFTPDQQRLARRIFLRLTELGDETVTGDTRRRATFDELMLQPEETRKTRALLQELADARLIVTDETTVEVAHEALIREWPRLRGWLEENREDLRLHRQLTQAAQEWQAMGHTPDLLYRGVRLDQAREWALIHDDEMNPLEREFLAASVEATEREAADKEEQRQRELEAARRLAESEKRRAGAERRRAEEQERAAKQLRRRALYLAGAFTLALIMAFTALFFGSQARQAAILTRQSERVAFSRELAVQSKLNLAADPERSILLALAALDQAHSQEAENMLHEALSTSRLRRSLRGHEGPVYYVAYSPDGRRIATAGGDRTVRIWDTETGDELLALSHPAAVGQVLFSPDGAHVISGAADGRVRLWELASRRELLTITVAQDLPLTPDPRIVFSAWSPDGSLLATVALGEGELRFWDPETGAELFTIRDPDWLEVAPAVDLVPRSIAFSPDGMQVAINLNSNGARLGRIEIWDVATRQKVQTLQGRFDLPTPLAFNPEGTRIVTPTGPGPDDRAAIWDIASGELLFTLGEPVNTIRYSADGKRLLSASYGGIARVFDAATGDELLALAGHTGRVFTVAESPGCVQPPEAFFAWCGVHLATASDDGTARVWDISPAGNQEVLTLPGREFALSLDGTRLSVLRGGANGSAPPFSELVVEQWRLAAGAQSDHTSGYLSSTVEFGDGLPSWFWFFPAGGIFAAAFDTSPLKFWDVTNQGKALYSLSCCPWTSGMALSYANRSEPRAAIGDPHEGTVIIWDLLAGAKVRTLPVAEPDELVAFDDPISLQTGNRSYGDSPIVLSADGERLATLKNDTTVEIWDVTTGEKQASFPGPAIIDGARLWFSPDANWLIVADCTGRAVVRDALTGAEVTRFSNDGACITGVAFHMEQKLIALTSAQLETKIFNFETWQEVVTLPGGWLVQFTPDGTRVLVATDSLALAPFAVQTYFVNLDDLVALARTRVTRSLTTRECQRYLHMPACPAQP
jgi:WD40 repeat protein/transcriptional regulator with XRE-family HTH domain